ncbi:hypothetical protein ACFVWN_28365 [Nocardiopsis flavescens]|uniref:Uncharacterized protein n=1 Tax=Nocardiopsis flavescens TaxID=758803 RepID=A0A1M6MJT7_9ACTN|nr:hypothetical protein [Nocardiopsis flavescens]SHJ83717.1 hypothetical protein SAMN05421803_11086 [Nocardiopsis flavescens]
MADFFRVHADYVGRVGVEVGVFVAVDHLRRAGLLSDAEEDLYLDIDDWFRDALPVPPVYADGNTRGAVTWFRDSVRGREDFTGRIAALRGILTAHGVAHRESTSDDPGTVLYEDGYQVCVLPRSRRPADPPPFPPGTVPGPTTAGSKRHLARRSARGPGGRSDGA